MAKLQLNTRKVAEPSHYLNWAVPLRAEVGMNMVLPRQTTRAEAESLIAEAVLDLQRQLNVVYAKQSAFTVRRS